MYINPLHAGALNRPHPAGAPARTAQPLVHIVDDDEAVRRSLAMLLASFGHATQAYESAETFLVALEQLRPGCAIIDIRMAGMDGLTLLEELRRRQVTIPVIIMTGHGEVAFAVRAMKAGAVDFVEKPYSDDDLLRAITSALAQSENDREQHAITAAAARRIDALTPREGDVLKQLVAGRPNKVIAHELGISPRTVEIHRANVMDKLGCRSLAEVVRLAFAAGFSMP